MTNNKRVEEEYLGYIRVVKGYIEVLGNEYDKIHENHIIYEHARNACRHIEESINCLEVGLKTLRASLAEIRGE